MMQETFVDGEGYVSHYEHFFFLCHWARLGEQDPFRMGGGGGGGGGSPHSEALGLRNERARVILDNQTGAARLVNGTAILVR